MVANSISRERVVSKVVVVRRNNRPSRGSFDVHSHDSLQDLRLLVYLVL